VNSIYEMTNYMEEFPSDLKNAIRKINSGEIKVNLTHKGIDAMVYAIHRVTRQVVTSFILVALIIGSTLFIVTEIPPFWKGLSVFGIVGLILALIMGIGIIRDIRKKDYQNW